ncbi:MAG: shikimate kinase [Sphingomonadales bacterium]|jgi:shikimate kinase
MTIILIGFKNSGKTSLGRALAKKVKLKFLDTDTLIEKAFYEQSEYSLPVRDIYLRLGEETFRTFEARRIISIRKGDADIISTGGGTVLNEGSAAHLKGLGKVIYLFTTPDLLFKRMMVSDRLPAFINEDDPKTSFETYFNKRAPQYLSIADEILDVCHNDLLKKLDDLKKTGGFYGRE